MHESGQEVVTASEKASDDVRAILNFQNQETKAQSFEKTIFGTMLIKFTIDKMN